MPFAILMSVNSALGREIIRAEGRGGLGGRGVWEERVFGDNSSLLNSCEWLISSFSACRFFCTIPTCIKNDGAIRDVLVTFQRIDITVRHTVHFENIIPFLHHKIFAVHLYPLLSVLR